MSTGGHRIKLRKGKIPPQPPSAPIPRGMYDMQIKESQAVAAIIQGAATIVAGVCANPATGDVSYDRYRRQQMLEESMYDLRDKIQLIGVQIMPDD